MSRIVKCKGFIEFVMTSLDITFTFSGVGSEDADAPDSKTAPPASSYPTEDIISLLTRYSIRDLGHAKSRPQTEQPLRHWYRVSHANSRVKEDIGGNLICDNQNWDPQSMEDIAMHFAEIHSDKENRKDTGLITITHDPIRALQTAYWEWLHTPLSSRETKASEIMINIIQTPDYHPATSLKDTALTIPLRQRVTKQARERLEAANNAYIHDSEAVCVQKIPRRHIKHRISFEHLLQKGLLNNILPELTEQHDQLERQLWPAEIRRRIDRSCNHRTGETSARFKAIYCMLAGAGDGFGTPRSLKLAQRLMHDDPSLDDWFKDVGINTLQSEIVELEESKKRVVVRNDSVSK
jgi:hypothetical protein